MLENFEFDTDGFVAANLARKQRGFIEDRVQELNTTKHGLIICESAKLAIPDDDSLLYKIERAAYVAGSTLVLEALDYSDLSKSKIHNVKTAFLHSGLPSELKKQEPEAIREQIISTAVIGHAWHPELHVINDLLSKYYAELTQKASMQIPVRLGVGRTAFVLDKCVGILREIDPQFEIAEIIETTDWSRINPEDIIKKER